VTATAAPDWLLREEVGLCPCGCVGRRSRRGFVEKTITGGADVVRQALFSEDIASRRGLLQAIEPRVKLLTMLALLIAAAFVRHAPVLLSLYLVTLVLAVCSQLRLSFFVRRVWLFVPLFTGLVVAPATLNLVTHGQIVVPLGTWFGHPVGLTRQGLEAAALIVSRVALSISLVVLLTLTTPWNRLLASLRTLWVPRVFVQVLGMTYRYLFHLVNGVGEMYTARTARTVRRNPDVVKGRAFVAATAGALFGRTHALSEEVHLAMVARGFTGSTRLLRPLRPRAGDAIWAAACLALIVAALGVDRVFG
jgi:cobalt/nickel transport system permease protein